MSKKIDIDMKEVERLARLGCPALEIASILGCSDSTIGRHCREVMRKAKGSLLSDLRQAQIKSALAGNSVMLIWLGKQLLGQHEPKQEVEHNTTTLFKQMNITKETKDE